ncbi:MAG: DUF4321 domain-containing protein [Clostridia bacterium]|nr:DUF4321 domain-containing protein [Clostridia bacterium]MDD4386857.1 DUF4321 domain-containing protein [Clostridia bacterium]
MKKIFTMVFIILGVIIGCAIGTVCSDIEPLKWLAIGGEVGFKNPLLIDLSFLQLTFGIWCKINIAGILCLVLFAFISNKAFKWLKI